MALRIAVAVLVLVGAGPLIAAVVGHGLELTTGLLFGGLAIHREMLLAVAMPLDWLRWASIGFGGVCLLAGLGMWWRQRWAWQLAQGLALAALASNLLQAVMATYDVMWEAETLRDGLFATTWLLLSFARWACVPVLLAFLLGSAPVASVFPGYARRARDRSV